MANTTRYDELKEIPLNYGRKHKGWPLREVPVDYLRWLTQESTSVPNEVRELAAEFLALPEVQRAPARADTKPTGYETRLVVFPLPRNNSIEIRLRKPVTATELPQLKAFLELTLEALVENPA